MQRFQLYGSMDEINISSFPREPIMGEQKDNRDYIRSFIPVPVVLLAPLLSDLRLIPEDISANGF